MPKEMVCIKFGGKPVVVEAVVALPAELWRRFNALVEGPICGEEIFLPCIPWGTMKLFDGLIKLLFAEVA